MNALAAAAEAAESESTFAVFVAALTIFVLALFVGFEVISKVPPLLHTPLMSGANAISGITLVGTLVTSGAKLTPFTTTLGFIAVAMATANVVGGFLVTHRMLEMFQRKGDRV
ncbi:MAG: NAD(P) transhydrogenase subunit alpha [Dehalococcoidia bacterium]